jgi:hypothetical protein
MILQDMLHDNQVEISFPYLYFFTPQKSQELREE